MNNKNERNVKRSYGRFDHKGKGKRAANKYARRAAKLAVNGGR